MWQSYLFGMYWVCEGRMYYDEVSAESRAAVEYFIDHKREYVTLVRVEYVGPNEGGVREPANLPYPPFDPLMARRKPGTTDDAR